MTDNAQSSLVLSAIGALLGYFGSSLASESLYSRLLFPARFHNSTDVKEFLATAFLMPLGGPCHKAALQTVDRFVSNGLFSGYCRGTMLGSAFFEDTQEKYYLVSAENPEKVLKDARNGLWFQIMEDLQMIPEAQSQAKSSNPKSVSDAPAERKPPIRSVKTVIHIQLCYNQEKALNTGPDDPRKSIKSSNSASSARVTEHLGPLKWHTVFGVLSSELIAMIVSLAVFASERSLYALWFNSPLLLKIIALVFRVRRQGLDLAIGNMIEQRETERVLASSESHRNGMLLVEGPRPLVLQFFRHYGHPERSRKGIKGDRIREVVCIYTVFASMMIFPIGLIAFTFAPPAIKLVWIYYQLYATLAMLIYRIIGGRSIGTTAKQLARKLRNGQFVRFEDGLGASIIVSARIDAANSVAELQVMFEDQKANFESRTQSIESTNG